MHSPIIYLKPTPDPRQLLRSRGSSQFDIFTTEKNINCSLFLDERYQLLIETQGIQKDKCFAPCRNLKIHFSAQSASINT